MRHLKLLSAVAWMGTLTLLAVVPGCASNGPPESVPPAARLVGKHSGTDDFVFVAPRDGEVYVYDRTAHKLVYSGRVKRART